VDGGRDEELIWRVKYGGGDGGRVGRAYALPRPLLVYEENVDKWLCPWKSDEFPDPLEQFAVLLRSEPVDAMLSMEVDEPEDELAQASSGGGPKSESGDELEESEDGNRSAPDCVGDNVESCSPSNMEVDLAFPWALDLGNLWNGILEVSGRLAEDKLSGQSVGEFGSGTDAAIDGVDGRELDPWGEFETVSFNRWDENSGEEVSMESQAREKGETVSCRTDGEGKGTSLGESKEACLFVKDGNRGMPPGMALGRGAKKDG
jgi:hypothetical protein